MTPDEILLVSPAQLNALPALTAPLLAWYRQNARRLPWRDEPTPYRVWVSEIMLQQTRVEAVRGYFARFIQALPGIPELAAAPEDTLLKLWEGLGYYSRVRNLSRAARILLAEHGGALPASYAALLTLPGVGEYTAGAIASIAFGIPVPAVDGNVYRVLSRVLASYADTSRPPVRRAFRAAAEHLLPEERPGDLNQALMELGALRCLPTGAPLCTGCPIAPLCAAHAAGCAQELPVRAQKKPRRAEERTILLVVAEGNLLLFRRGARGLLAGLYEPLNLPGHLTVQQAADAVRALGGAPQQPLALPGAKHVFSHVEWHMQAYLVPSAPFAAGQALWADSAEFAALALPSAFAAFRPEMLRQLRF